MTQNFEPGKIVNRLSPAARETLNELVESYRLRLLQSVDQAAPDGEVSASDLLRNAVQMESHDIELEQVRHAAEDAYRARRDQVFLFASAFVSLILALLVGMIGLGRFIGWDLDSLTGPVAAAVAASGIVAAYATLLIALTNRMRLRRRMRDLEYRQAMHYNWATPAVHLDSNTEATSQKYARAGLFMAGWREVEESLYRLGRDILGTDPSKHMALSTIVIALTKQGVLAESAAREAQWAVDVRNRLVHGDGMLAVSESDVQRLARLANTLGAIAEHSS